jgi:predicted DNA-binding transcriptional regulator AlpA
MPTSIGNDAEAVLVDHKDLERLGVKFSNAWLLKLEQRGDFPRRLSIGGRETVWLLTEVKAAITRAPRRIGGRAPPHRSGRGRCPPWWRPIMTLIASAVGHGGLLPRSATPASTPD